MNSVNYDFVINLFLNKLFSAFTPTPGKNDKMLKTEVFVSYLKANAQVLSRFYFQLLIYLAFIIFTILNLKKKEVCL